MKKALCLSGISRYTEETFPLLKEFLVDENTDIYVHTWDIPHDGFTPYHQWYIDQGVKSISMDYYEIFQQRFPHKNSVIPMYYSIWKANSLIQGDYDVVIRCRSDIWFREAIPEDELRQVKKNKDIIFVRYNGDIPPREDSKGKFVLRNGISYVADQFAFGSPEAMNIYADTFNHIPEIETELLECKDLLFDPELGMSSGELALGAHLKNNSQVYPVWSTIQFDMPTGIDNDVKVQIGNSYNNQRGHHRIYS